MPKLTDREMDERVIFCAHIALVIDDAAATNPAKRLSLADAYRKVFRSNGSPFVTYSAFERFNLRYSRETSAKKQEIYWNSQEAKKKASIGRGYAEARDMRYATKLAAEAESGGYILWRDGNLLRIVTIDDMQAVKHNEDYDFRKRIGATRDDLIEECTRDPHALARMVDSYLKMLGSL